MRKPINIPCLLCLNHEEIAQAVQLDIKPPKEERVEHELTFFTVDVLEEYYIYPKGNELNARCCISSGGREYSTRMKKSEILDLMIEAGWYDR